MTDEPDKEPLTLDYATQRQALDDAARQHGAIKFFLPHAIVASLICPPPGLVALFYSIQSRIQAGQGRLAEAQAASHRSVQWGMCSILLAAFIVLIILLVASLDGII